MAKLTKKAKALQGKVDSTKLYPLATRWRWSRAAPPPSSTNPSTWPCNWASTPRSPTRSCAAPS
jgi:hypothetical protein